MNAPVVVPTFPQNPFVGQVFNGYCWNGSAWVCSQPPVATLQLFTANGTYWPSPGLTYAIVEAIGGGGGGGGALAAYTGTPPGWVCGGGGGASGCYGRSIFPAAVLLNGIVITIGAGGAGGAVTPTAGGAGQATSFGSLMSILGGAGGIQCDSSTGWGAGGPRSTGTSTAQLFNHGNGGGIGMFNFIAVGEAAVVAGGQGAGSFFGGQGTVNFISTGANNGLAGFYGAGGDGGASVLHTAGASGGAGGSGIVVITEYCFGNTSTVQACCPAPGCPPGVTEVPPTPWGVPWGVPQVAGWR
jgi:hypothetical protein